MRPAMTSGIHLPALALLAALTAACASAPSTPADPWLLSSSFREAADPFAVADLSVPEPVPTELTATLPVDLLAHMPAATHSLLLVDIDAILDGMDSGHLYLGYENSAVHEVRQTIAQNLSMLTTGDPTAFMELIPNKIALAGVKTLHDQALVILIQGEHVADIQELLMSQIGSAEKPLFTELSGDVLSVSTINFEHFAEDDLLSEAAESISLLSSDSMFAMHLSLSALLTDTSSKVLLAQMMGGITDSLSFAMSGDGSADFLFRGSEGLSPHNLILSSINALRHYPDELATEELHGLVEPYFNMLASAFNSWIQSDEVDDHLRISLPAVRCGAPMNQYLVIAAIGAGIYRGFTKGIDLTAGLPDDLPQVTISEGCETLEGSSPPIEVTFFDTGWEGGDDLEMVFWFSFDEYVRRHASNLTMLPFALDRESLLELEFAQRLEAADHEWLFGPLLAVRRYVTSEFENRFLARDWEWTLSEWAEYVTGEDTRPSWIDERFTESLGSGRMSKPQIELDPEMGPEMDTFDRDEYGYHRFAEIESEPRDDDSAMRTLAMQTMPHLTNGLIMPALRDVEDEQQSPLLMVGLHADLGWLYIVDTLASSEEASRQLLRELSSELELTANTAVLGQLPIGGLVSQSLRLISTEELTHIAENGQVIESDSPGWESRLVAAVEDPMRVMMLDMVFFLLPAFIY